MRPGVITTPVGYEIGAPRSHELADLSGIEIAAAAMFPPEDLASELRQKRLPLSFFEQASSAGRLWVARTVEPAAPLTLTTFGHLPWNAPFYGSVGFATIDDRDLGPQLRAAMAKEAERGLDPRKRVAMRLDLHAGNAP